MRQDLPFSATHIRQRTGLSSLVGSGCSTVTQPAGPAAHDHGQIILAGDEFTELFLIEATGFFTSAASLPVVICETPNKQGGQMLAVFLGG